MSRRIVTIALLFAIAFMSIPHSTSVPLDILSQGKTLDDLIVYSEAQHGDDSSNPDSQLVAEYLSVTIKMEETFINESNSRPQTQEERAAHNQELKNHYSQINEDLVAYFNLQNYDEITCSKYGPFIEYRYFDESDFYDGDKYILEDKVTDGMEVVYVRSNEVYLDVSDDSDDAATDYEGDTSFYEWENILSDVGIPQSNIYDGSGINIGVLEGRLPSQTSHLSNVNYELMSTAPTGVHAYHTSYILGGNYGIAPGASLYFANIWQSSGAYDEITAYDWLIEKNVDIINRSESSKTGSYDSSAAYADYIVYSTFTIIVSAIGTKDANYYMGSPSTGLNVICVAAIDKEWEMSTYNSTNMKPSSQLYLLKPLLCAPGVKLDLGVFRETGSSFSAPIVTGIIALLMDEFGMYSYPEFYMSLLASSCNVVSQQIEQVDMQAGFGLVNYTNARNNYNSASTYTITDETTLIGMQAFSKQIIIEPGKEILANTVVCYNSPYSEIIGDNSMPANAIPDFTRIKLAIQDVATGQIFYGNAKSNFSYLRFCNNSSVSRTYKLIVYLDSSKTIMSDEFCSLSYAVKDLHVHNYVYNFENLVDNHRAYCVCGVSRIEDHWWEIVDPNALMCMQCGQVQTFN